MNENLLSLIAEEGTEILSESTSFTFETGVVIFSGRNVLRCAPADTAVTASSVRGHRLAFPTVVAHITDH
jgi:hypothetical protein